MLLQTAESSNAIISSFRIDVHHFITTNAFSHQQCILIDSCHLLALLYAFFFPFFLSFPTFFLIRLTCRRGFSETPSALFGNTLKEKRKGEVKRAAYSVKILAPRNATLAPAARSAKPFIPRPFAGIPNLIAIRLIPCQGISWDSRLENRRFYGKLKSS